MRKFASLLTLFLTLATPSFAKDLKELAKENEEQRARAVIQSFNEAFEQRNREKMESIFAADAVIIGAGQQFHGFPDYRDRVLNQLFQRPAAPSLWEVEKLDTSSKMAWAYTTTTRKFMREGQPVENTLWTVFILEKRASRANGSEDWKIVLLDSMGKRPPLQAQSGQDPPDQVLR